MFPLCANVTGLGRATPADQLQSGQFGWAIAFGLVPSHPNRIDPTIAIPFGHGCSVNPTSTRGPVHCVQGPF